MRYLHNWHVLTLERSSQRSGTRLVQVLGYRVIEDKTTDYAHWHCRNNFPWSETGLFSDQPGLTHVVYHEIDTGDKGPVVSRPYKYDRVKQGIDYHIDKMLRDGTICPINSPYASPVVLTRKRTMTFLRFSRGVSFRDRLSETKCNYQISSISITGY
ncbi:hypothetical protein TNCV_2016351 [Trichonephila clavipes]|nr:hypothetical protein TNCV_2016351 [Trichonephila clavipes]